MTDSLSVCSSCGRPVSDPELVELCNWCAYKYGLIECHCMHSSAHECCCVSFCPVSDDCPADQFDFELGLGRYSTPVKGEAERSEGYP